MCELLGLSSNLPATVSISLERLAGHGVPPTSIRDGWGIAYYDDADVRLIKDAGAANDSAWLRFVSTHNLRSNIVMAQIRKATMGVPSYRNAQSFMREMAGRMHTFAHNGWLHGIREAPAFGSSRFAPVGETDWLPIILGSISGSSHFVATPIQRSICAWSLVSSASK